MVMRMNRPERAGFSLAACAKRFVNGMPQISGNFFRDGRLRPGAHRAGEGAMGIVWTIVVGFVIGVVQDSCETALNSSTDVLFTAAATRAAQRRAGLPVPSV